MIISVDTQSATPPYDQIREQVAAMVVNGVITPGTRLPTIRQLAADLDLAPGTVTRAYRELESGGYLVSRGRHGTFVADRPRVPNAERKQRLVSEARRFARTAVQLGARPNEILEAVERALQP